MTLTVAIPTIGRPTLARTVFSFIDQLHDGDEVIIVADPKGDTEYAEWIHGVGTNKLGVNWQFDIYDEPDSGWGQAQRRRAYALASPGNHVWCLADDDVATPGALDAIRLGVEHDPKSWLLYRVGRGNDEPWVWQDKAFRVGNLDADCIVAPASVHARWGLEYTGDMEFAHSLAYELGLPFWKEQVIAVTKPNADYLAAHYQGLSGTIPWTAASIPFDRAEPVVLYDSVTRR